MRKSSIGVLAAALAVGTIALAQLGPAAGAAVDRGWPGYNNDLYGQRFSALKEINKANVANLKQVCSIKLQDGGSFHASPIVVDGAMYVTTARDTVALDPVTCAQKWRHSFVSADEDVFPNNRGVAYDNGRLFRGTATGVFFALDAATGKVLWTTQVGNGGIGEFISAAPVAWGGLVFVPVAGSDWGVRGRVVALDAATGREAWRFNTIPTGDETGADTWQNKLSTLTGGGGMWTTLTLDPSTGELLAPVGNPAPDLDASYRPGDNLFTDSIISLNARDGKLRWYHQHKKNDSIDHDVSAAPVVFRDPNLRDILAFAGKDGRLVALDRNSHEVLYSTPVTTIENINAVADEKGQHVCPGLLGGVEWNGPAYDPKSNTLFTGAVDWCTTFKKGKPKYVQGELFFGGDPVMDEKVNGGWITAVNASTGETRWKYKTDFPVVSGVTPTAGGVVFAGDTSGRFFGLDSDSGKPLYTLETKGMVAGGVITYSVAGKQYVALTSGNTSRITFGALGDPTLIVLALP
jgi:PQQ-dependent dehydrogenase (methanol/ethanol family)